MVDDNGSSLSFMLEELFDKITETPKDNNSILFGEKYLTLCDLVHEWVQLVDWKIEQIRLKEVVEKGMLTTEQKYLKEHRLFTMEEYLSLFINEIQEDQYLAYAPYRTLKIKSKAQLTRQIYSYEYSKHDYERLLMNIIPQKILQLFRSKKSYLANIPQSILEMNVAFIGGSGTGKTTLLASTIDQLIQRRKGYSFVVIDPHGDITKRLSKLKIDEDRLMFFTLKDFEKNGKIFSYNVFDIQESDDLNLGKSIEQIVDAISELPVDKGHSLSAGMNSLLTFCLKFLFKEVKDPTLMDLHKLLSLDPQLLTKAQAFDDFFVERFPKGERQTREAARRRVENALKNDVMKQILCSESTFNLEQAVNSNKVMLFDLSGLGVETQVALGKFIIANLKNYVRKRSIDPLKYHTYLVIDEAQNFLGKDYDYILEQMRKFGLHTMLACQYLNQLKDNVETVRFNTAVKVIAGDNPKDFSSIMSVPNQFLKIGVDNKVYNRIDLKKYEFLVSVRNGDTIKIKSPSYLVDSYKPYRTESKQDIFEENQYNKYYKTYNETQKTIVSIPKNELEPLKVSGDTMSLPEVKTSTFTKDRKLLYELSRYKFLTIQNMLDLKISSSQSNLPNSKLEKDGLVKSVRVQLEGSSTNIKVYFLTKQGAKYIANDSEDDIQVNYPTSRITKLGQAEHKIGVINHAIQFNKYDLDYFVMDIHNSGKRNFVATQLSFDTKKISPDMLFCINTPRGKEHFLFEFERLKDVGKSFKKVLLHNELMSSQSFQRTYNHNKEYRVLWVFEEFSTMTGVMEKCKESKIPLDNHLFKLQDQPIDAFINYDQERKSIFYV